MAQTTSGELPVPIPVGIPVFALSPVAFGNRFLALRRRPGEAALIVSVDLLSNFVSLIQVVEIASIT
ncbi:hypothetical protein BST13_02265 [Mycobacterium aquaticum]|uniref:Uncharacterized protein n=1 Tax=Mycobacterium aquaticum TaxID=1927124 RepID=A0A1X0BA90_9MYCO|nr:hypothetical protein BST13_02265 [Mycobacterium aquaticum]